MTTIVCPNCHRAGSSSGPVPNGVLVKCPSCGGAFRFQAQAQPPLQPPVPATPPASPTLSPSTTSAPPSAGGTRIAAMDRRAWLVAAFAAFVLAVASVGSYVAGYHAGTRAGPPLGEALTELFKPSRPDPAVIAGELARTADDLEKAGFPLEKQKAIYAEIARADAESKDEDEAAGRYVEILHAHRLDGIQFRNIRDEGKLRGWATPKN